MGLSGAITVFVTLVLCHGVHLFKLYFCKVIIKLVYYFITYILKFRKLILEAPNIFIYILLIQLEYRPFHFRVCKNASLHIGRLNSCSCVLLEAFLHCPKSVLISHIEECSSI